MRLSLKYLIGLVALLSVVLTLAASIISGYRAEQQSLIDGTLETNRAYAEKMAKSTDSFFSSTLQTLKVSAKHLSPYMSPEYVDEYLIPETNRLKEQTNTFNSVLIVDKEGEILSTSPQTLDLMGKKLDSKGGKEALKKREAYISQPYVGLTGRLIIFISHPIFDENGRYLGLIGGTIYLKEDNILQEVLGEHFYENGSYVYVVDQSGRIIYHQNQERVNDIVLENPVVQQLLVGRSGAMEVVNTKDVEMLAGYASLQITNWGVVTQRSKEESLAPSVVMIKEMAKMTIPFLVISLLVILYIAHQIANPLTKLASYAESSTENNQEEKINKVRAWYYEAIQLKKALNYSLNFFQDRVNFFIHQSTIDPLTKLMNRRAMDAHLKTWTEQEIPYAVLIFDIDKFKRVNDTYGHAVGDEVLKYLAESMLEVTRKEDICCRFGGEEFVILLPETDQSAAFHIAERLRKKLESTISPCGEVVTISIGMATYPKDGTHPAELLELADQCLYEAKRAGRNRTVECATLMK
ncbi:sensor domain-containing diguanylate cyclase [Sporosarcina koreensis]|uniref:sensor domain-containing diguanylate cyclase n=1 Tax=Sporosarcina koreensis TaxID=334735 RepID=UPI000756084B|nr:sensor domain-containing diguanylate cyclase [Sporosarcina koreensis]